jgi:hypothetical protein
MMKRLQWNLWINLLAFLALLLLISTGAVLQFVLPHGSPSRGLTLWGWDRHQWGELHTWVSWVFLGLMLLHLFLHWAWIRSQYFDSFGPTIKS